MRHPAQLRASTLAAAMVPAALAAAWIPFHPALLALPLLTGLLQHRLPALRPLLLFSLCLLLATARLHPPANDLRRTLPPEPAHLALEFDIAGDPVTSPDGTRVPVILRAVQYLPEWTPVTGRAQLRLDAPPPPHFLPGTRWRARGRLDPSSLAHTGLRRADWLLRPDPQTLTPLPVPPAARLRSAFYRIRETLATRLDRATAADPEAGAVLQALLLARRGEVDDTWTTAFARTGLLHIFAVSGLHLGILTLLLLSLCRRLGLPYRARAAAVLPILLLFTACTGFRASALRALIMAACLLAAPLFYRRSRTPDAFALALFLLLAWAPEQLFDIGFQFSFLLVGGLLLTASLFQTRLTALLRGDPWAPPEVQWPWWKQKFLQPAADTLLVSTLCFVLAAPLTARAFNLFSPVALLGNLLAVPLAFLLLTTGFPALLLLPAPTPLAAAALLPARTLARLLLDWVQLLETIPGGVWWVRAPALWELLALYLLPLTAFRFPRTRRLCLALALTALGFSATRHLQTLTRTEAVIADADRGQSTRLRAGPRPVLLVDAGNDWSGPTLAAALQADGVNRIEALFLTHPSRHHVQGLPAITETHPPRRIYVAQPDRDHPLYEGLDVIPLQAGDRLHLAGWQIDVLWPPADWPARAAGNRSLVLRFSRQTASLLVMGGADERVEAELLARGLLLPARLLHAANSPRTPAASPPFLQALRPEAAVLSGTDFGGPSPAREQTRDRLLRHPIPLWQVREDQPLRFDLTRGTRIP